MRRWAKKPRKPIDIDQCEVVTVKVRKLLIEIWWKAELQSWRDLKALVMRWKSWKAALDLGLAWSNLWLSSPREKLTLRTQSSYFREVTLRCFVLVYLGYICFSNLCHTTTSLISGETKGQIWKSFFDHKCLRVGEGTNAFGPLFGISWSLGSPLVRYCNFVRWGNRGWGRKQTISPIH